MTTRRCHHDTTWSHVDGETICDACEEEVGDDFATRLERQSIYAFEQKLRDEGVDMTDSYDIRVRALKNTRAEVIARQLKDR